MSIIWCRYIAYFVEVLISYIFLSNKLEEKYNKALSIATCCVIVVFSTVCAADFCLIRTVVTELCLLAYTIFMYNGKLAHKVGVFFFKVALMVAASIVSYAIYSNFACINSYPLFALEYTECSYSYDLMFLLILSTFTSIGINVTKKNKGVELVWVIGTHIIMGVAEVATISSVVYKTGGVIGQEKLWLSTIATVCMIITNISIGLVAPYLLNKYTMESSIDYGKDISNMEYKYYEMSVENDKKIRAIKHDIANQIQIAYSLINDGDNQRGLALMDELKSRYTFVEQIVYCNNSIVNIILSNKKSEAEQSNIETSIDIKGSLENIPITDYDLSSVICNLLDNAIKGCICSEQPNQKIDIEIFQKNQYLVVRVLNSCKIEMNIEGTSRIETTKKNKKSHGLGMAIIANVVEKYRGDFRASAQNGTFTATAIMSINDTLR